VLNALGRQGRTRRWYFAKQLQEAGPIQSFLGRQVIGTPVVQRHSRSRQAATEKSEALSPRDIHGLSPYLIYYELVESDDAPSAQ